MAKKTSGQKIEELEAISRDINLRLEQFEAKLSKINHLSNKTSLVKSWVIDNILNIINIFIIGIFGSYIAYQSYKISKYGTDRNLELMYKSNELIEKSNTITKDGTDRSLLLMSKSNEIIQHSDSLMSNSISVMENSNKLIEISNSLEESSRKSSYLPLVDNLIQRINISLESGDYNLSNSLIEAIASQSNILSPFYHLEEDGKKNINISIGRGLLFRHIAKSNISQTALDNIFRNTNFEYSFIPNFYIDSLNIRNAKMANSWFNGSKFNQVILSEVDFNGSNFDGTTLDRCIIKDATTFNQCSFKDVNFTNTVFEEKTQFFDVNFINADLGGSTFKNIHCCKTNISYNSCRLQDTKFENVFLTDVKFENCFWDNTGFINCTITNTKIDLNQKHQYSFRFSKKNIQGFRGGSYAQGEVKIKMQNCKISPENLLLKNEHFLENHTIKDTMINNKKMLIANFKG